MYRIRKYDPTTDKISVVEVELDELIHRPTGLNMADIGIVLLNELRDLDGLEPIPVSSIADNIEEWERRGTNG